MLSGTGLEEDYSTAVPVTVGKRQNGSSIKKIISNELSYHANLGLLNSDGSTLDGKFSAEDCEELAFHHRYNFRTDHLVLCVELNTHPKCRGLPTGPSLAETDVKTIKVTKQVLARLAGQAYQISGSF